MTMSTPTGGPGEERTLGQLVASASEDLSTILRTEIALAKAEVTTGAKVMGKGVGLLGAAGFLSLLAPILLLQSPPSGLVAAGLPVWAGYLIVAVVLLLLTAILALALVPAVAAAADAAPRARDLGVPFYGTPGPPNATSTR